MIGRCGQVRGGFPPALLCKITFVLDSKTGSNATPETLDPAAGS
jgi:hypothetical protein